VRKSFIPFRDEVQQYRLSLLHSDVAAASNTVARARSQAESIAARHRLSDTLAACSNWTAAAYILEPVYWLTTNGSVAACQGTALRLAELNMAGADFAAAAEWYARAPVQNYATVYGQAQAWMSANMPDRAVEFYTRACVLRPGLVTPLLELALAQDVLGDADAVDATCTRIRDLLARIPASRRQRAMALPEYRRLKERVGERLPE
jgi:tetratricopeptide (TPR) repeat protein